MELAAPNDVLSVLGVLDVLALVDGEVELEEFVPYGELCDDIVPLPLALVVPLVEPDWAP